MLEEDYTSCLNKLLENCEHQLVIPSQLRDSLTKRGPTPPSPNDLRKYVRYHFNGLSVLEVAQTFPSIPREKRVARVVTRNVSRGGIAFLHSEQLFPGEEVTMWLPSGKFRYVVVRCIAHHPRCYEIGADATQAAASQQIDLQQLGVCR